MGDAKYEELILDAIDQLRKRKARPDLDRICHMLERRHGLKGSDVNDELSRLVNDGIVIKVDYKGNTSYRNAAKWVRTKSQFFGSFFNSSDISAAVLEAVDALSLPVAEQASPITKSASIHEIERYLLKRDAQSNLNIATLRAVLEKEVANGSIKQLPSGDFITKRSNPSSTNLEIPNDSQVDDPCKRNRLINAKKRLKTTHENGCVETPGVISSDLSHESCCDYCLLTANANRKGVAEELLVCKDCNAKAHPSCMDYNTELAARSQLSPWQCTDCKTCTICEDSGDGDLMLFCDLCDKGYHMNCHIPSVTTKPTGKWVCAYCCSNSSNKESHSISTKNASSSDIYVSDIYVLDTGDPLLSAEVNDHFEDKSLEFLFEECLQKYPDVIPLAESWSIEDVEAFFKCIGYQEEAPAFKEQEIDGQSLLLMKRSDVLTGLSLKLGPALKIYNHIKRLQGKLSSGHFA